MTQFNDDDFDEENDEGEVQKPVLDKNIRAQLKRADEQRKELETLKGQLAEQQRNSAFDKAGIPEDGLGTMFRKGYDGEVSAEAIRRTAVDYGLLNASVLPNNDSLTDSELEALRKVQGATTGGDGNSPDAEQKFLAELTESKNPEDVMKAVNGESGQKIGVFSQRGPL